MSAAACLPPVMRRQVDPRLEFYERNASRIVEAEYHEDVLNHYRQFEPLIKTDPDMMDLQPEIQWYMRPYLLEFLIDSHHCMRLQPESLFLAISILDRYCSVRVVFKKHYQLVGCTALWIAAKYEEKKSRIPQLRELSRICCGAYEEDMFLQMERHVLSTLEWSVGLPTIESFLSSMLGPDAANSTLAHVSRYLCEITLFHRGFLAMSPSLIASSAYVFAQFILGHIRAIPHDLSAQQIQCINIISVQMETPAKSLAKKYSKPGYAQAAIHVQNYIAQNAHTAPIMPPTPPPVSVSSMLPTPPGLCSSSAASSPIYTPTASPAVPAMGMTGIGKAEIDTTQYDVSPSGSAVVDPFYSYPARGARKPRLPREVGDRQFGFESVPMEFS